VKKAVSKNIGYPLKDWQTKSPILKVKNFLDKSQYWDKNKIEEYQLKKLKALVLHAYENVPYYNRIFNELKLKPADIKTLSDIKKIPILTKEVARRENMNLVSRDASKRRYFKAKTGGTSGPPLVIYKDINSYSFEWGSFYRWYNWIGIELGDPMVTLWGSPSVLSESRKHKFKKRISDALLNHMSVNSFTLNDKTFPALIKQLNKFKPKILKGYLSAMLQLAKYVEQHTIKFDFSLTAISTTSETLFPYQKKYLEKVFKCKVYDQYGCTEVCAVSYECAKQNGMHINHEHVFVEVVSGDHLQDVRAGKLVLTDLDEFSMPMIRYENGDTATLSDKICDCGVKQPLIASIDGRVANTIRLKNGSEVHGVFFTDILFEIKSKGADDIIKFQVYQEKEAAIEFRIEAKQELSKEFNDELKAALLNFFNTVNIVKLTTIPPGPSGKHLYVVSKLTQE